MQDEVQKPHTNVAALYASMVAPPVTVEDDGGYSYPDDGRPRPAPQEETTYLLTHNPLDPPAIDGLGCLMMLLLLLLAVGAALMIVTIYKSST